MIYQPYEYQQFAEQFIIDRAAAGLLLDMIPAWAWARRLSP